MGTVLIHSGRLKTGSTSIQRWLRMHATQLREAHRISIVHVLKPRQLRYADTRDHIRRLAPADHLWRPDASALPYLYAALTDLITHRSGN